MARILKGGMAFGALLGALIFSARSFAQSRPCGCYFRFPATVPRLGLGAFVVWVWVVYSVDVVAQVRGRCVPTPPCYCSDECLRCGPGGCRAPGGSAGSPSPSVDYEAERRAREEAERQREEAERREQDRLKAERQKQFENERDAAAKSLKGGGAAVAPGLKTAAPSSAAPVEWTRMHCSASILGPALSAATPSAGKAADFAESRYLLDEAQKALNGQPLGVQCGAAPAPQQAADLARARMNQLCLTERARTAINDLEQAPRGTAKEAQTRKDIERLAAAVKRIESGAADSGVGCGAEPAPSRTVATDARREQLVRQVERDVEAIRRLGFARREEDFAEWDRLAKKAKDEFESEVRDTLVDIAVDATRGKMLDTFKTFDAAKASKIVAWIRARGIKPEPAALISAIERVGRATDKSRVTDDAEFIVKQIEDYRKARAAAADPVESAKFVSGLLEGTVSDPRLKFLITEIKLTTASVYNNATRRVARTEVERLTTLTEKQLKDLDRLQKLMAKHVQELNALKNTGESASK